MEHVILVDNNDRSIGTMEKMEAHRKGLLHRAFSVFIFDTHGNMLLQKRASAKYHSGGLWTNSCCSHPRPGEDTLAAANRRLQEEMGFATDLEKIFDFVYKADFNNGLTEYEFDHVFLGIYNGVIAPNPDEVCEYNYLSLDKIQESMQTDPALYTAWFHIAFPKIQQWLLQRQLA